jgi:hypothetical protein
MLLQSYHLRSYCNRFQMANIKSINMNKIQPQDILYMILRLNEVEQSF